MSERVRAAVRRLAQGQAVIFTGQAEQVDAGAGTCSVIPSDGGPPYFEVSLKAHPDAKAYSLPVEGSEVVCAQLTDQVVIVIGVAEPDRVVMEVGDSLMMETGSANMLLDSSISLSVGNTELQLASGGVKVSAGGQSLKAILSDLLAALELLAPIAAAPGSPCAPNPADVAKIQALKARLQALLT